MTLLNTISRLTWKQTSIISVYLLLIAFGFIADQAVRNPVSTQSKAGHVLPSPTPSIQTTYPNSAPVIDRLEPWFGNPGDMIRVRGSAFGDIQRQSTVSINGHITPITAWSNHAIDLILPDTTSGMLVITIGSGFSTQMPVSISTPNGPYLSLENNQPVIHNLDQPSTLWINHTHSFSLTPTNNPVTINLSIDTVFHASLVDDEGYYLPLSMPPETLLQF